MLRVIMCCIIMLGLFGFAQAQTKTITGKVVDANGIPLLGVNVLLKNTSTGSVTDFDGKYQIKVDDQSNATLVFTYLGYEQKEVSVAGKTVIDVTLNESAEVMDEVVITALGIKKSSRKLGYSATSVKTEDLVVNRTTNVMESLTGKVAGLNITPPAAGAGASTKIRLRGQSTFAGGNNAPLIVINGLPMDQGARGTNGNGQQRDRGDALLSINPDDIENMTVLKGATAAALYGSRAANGAILITTKSGSKGTGIGVEYSVNYTSQHALDFFENQQVYGSGQGGNRPTTQGQASQMGQFGWGERLDGAMTPTFAADENGDVIMRPYSANPNRLKDYFNTGINLTHSVALSGGGENGSFRASISSTESDGIEPTNEYKRTIANIGINHNITDKLKLSLNVNYSHENQINPPQVGTQGSGSMNFFTRIATSIPLELMRDYAFAPNGTEYRVASWSTIRNPYYAQQAGQYYGEIRDRLLATATLRYDFTDWLYVQGRYNYDLAHRSIESKNPGGIGTTNPFNGDGTYRGSYAVDESNGTDINADFLIGASKTFGKLSVDASIGGNTFRVKDKRLFANASNFINRDFFALSNGTIQNQGNDYTLSEVNSLYALADFGYDDTFFLNLTGRNDWFSQLNPTNNDVFYPSISGSVIVSELLPETSWLDYAKIRSSWAETGSINGVGVYDGTLAYGIDNNQFNGQTTAGIASGNAPNPALTTYTVTEKEIGLELRMFSNKLRVDIGAFEKVTTDQILDVQLSPASGYNESKENLGSLKNFGLETLIEYTPIQNDNFRWTTSWNHTAMDSEVLSVGKNPDGTPIDDFLVIDYNRTGNEFLGQLHYTVGMAMNQLYIRKFLRTPSGEKILRDNGRLRATDDYHAVGSANAKMIGGWSNTFTYKKLTLGVFLDYKFGGKVLSSTLLNMTRQGHSLLSLEGRREGENGLLVEGVQNTGTDENPVYVPNTTVVDQADLQTFYSDYRSIQIGEPFLFKSDFIKLRNISISYDFTDVLKKYNSLKFFKGLSFTASARNVAILYKDLPNLDPEAVQSSGDTRVGYENSSLPTTRSFSFALTAKF
ncbi:SusC/RagA family TonB-linked outer membrane protein [Thalassobellus sediminis]|uniref:SusC/RagA family TonB-linked outer membrane protein n=1 Tax=Thalassobellus sediminis TaxID=3367753 RepID=UPI003F6DFD2E